MTGLPSTVPRKYSPARSLRWRHRAPTWLALLGIPRALLRPLVSVDRAVPLPDVGLLRLAPAGTGGREVRVIRPLRRLGLVLRHPPAGALPPELGHAAQLGQLALLGHLVPG